MWQIYVNMREQKMKKANQKRMTVFRKFKLPSESNATSELLGAQRPHLIGVGDNALSNG